MPEALLKLKVSEVMNRSPVCFCTTDSIARALSIMVENPFNSFPLLDDKQMLLGIVSQSQIYDGLKDGAITRESPAAHLTPTTIATIHGDTLVADGLETLMRSGRNKCLVVDQSGKLQGVLTPIDLLARQQALK
jgi:predicted transcriptional regulator